MNKNKSRFLNERTSKNEVIIVIEIHRKTNEF